MSLVDAVTEFLEDAKAAFPNDLAAIDSDLAVVSDQPDLLQDMVSAYFDHTKIAETAMADQDIFDAIRDRSAPMVTSFVLGEFAEENRDAIAQHLIRIFNTAIAQPFMGAIPGDLQPVMAKALENSALTGPAMADHIAADPILTALYDDITGLVEDPENMTDINKLIEKTQATLQGRLESGEVDGDALVESVRGLLHAAVGTTENE